MVKLSKKIRENCLIYNCFYWISAFIIAVLIVNVLLFFYERPVGWLDTFNGSSEGIQNPGKIIVHGEEGYGIYRVDENGYLNDGFPKAEGYILIVGSSQTQGLNIKNGNRYSDILLRYTNENSDNSYDGLSVYNLSHGAYYFPKIVKHFPAVIGEFPNSKCIIIETGTVDFNIEDLEGAIQQIAYDKKNTGKELIKNVSVLVKFKMIIKEYFPIIKLVQNQCTSAGENIVRDKSIVDRSDLSFDALYYKELLCNCMFLLKNEYDGNIAIVYHPDISICASGIEIKGEKGIDAFKLACENNDIRFVDMSDIFVDSYNDDYTVPYGTINTSMGGGHLNSKGHKLIADELYKQMQEWGW